MVRDITIELLTKASSPHARGDGPEKKRWKRTTRWFSPRAWGWSDVFPVTFCPRCVLPTRVGMVRKIPALSPVSRGSPHARGDGPLFAADFARVAWFSPRAWGWSVRLKQEEFEIVVLPTRVGMVRTMWWEAVLRFGSPHARGDGPLCWLVCDPPAKFSPRAWGWSVERGNGLLPFRVLPTRVGMVRIFAADLDVPTGSPHARGDGP